MIAKRIRIEFLVVVFSLLSSGTAFATPEFYFDVEGGAEKPVSSNLTFDSVTWSPAGRIEFESRFFDLWGVFAGFDWDYLLQANESLAPWFFYGANVGTGVRYRFLDRLGLRAEGWTGVYTGQHQYSSESLKLSGMTVGATAGIEFRVTPSLSLTANGVYNCRLHNEIPLQTVRASVGLSINLSEIISPKEEFSVNVVQVQPVFPVLYSWYNDNPFATIEIANGEDTSISDVDVYFYSQKYMAQPKYCGRIDRIKRSASATINLTAFFNESVLQLVEKTDAACSILLEYKKLGEKRNAELSVSIPIYHRNAMNWEDDRRAASFVSANDIEVQEFAKKIASMVRTSISINMSESAQYAAALFDSLALYGIKYSVDPASAYADNAGSFSIDFLQYPHQTLNYFGGDCDDLSILYCSLMEALGYETAFITIPGHIFTAVLVGEQNVATGLSDTVQNTLIEQNGKLWMPVEITMIGDSFSTAIKFGSDEWNKAASSDTAKLYPVHESWKLYKSVSAPGAENGIFIPKENQVINAFLKEKNAL